MKWLMRISVMIVAVLMLFPLLLLFMGSLMSEGELLDRLSPLFEGNGYASLPLVPRILTLAGYVRLLFDQPSFLNMFWNSVFLVLPTLALQAIVSTLAAWGFAKYRFPLRSGLFLLYITLMLLPFQVTMVPTYMVLDRLGLLGSRSGVVLSQAFSAFAVFLLYRFFRSIPSSVMEAAQMDGAGPIRIFLRIGLPLGAPGVMSLLVLNFIELWNLIEPPMVFIKDQALWPLSLFQPQFSRGALPLTFAASVAAMLPPLLLFLYGQTYLEQGISAMGQKD